MAPWGLHISRWDASASLLLQAVTFFPLFSVYFLFDRLLRASIVIASSQTKPPLFGLSHSRALFLLFPNSVKSFTRFFFFQILAYFVIYFLRCDAHSCSLMCPRLRIPDLESWSPVSVHTKITSALCFCFSSSRV